MNPNVRFVFLTHALQYDELHLKYVSISSPDGLLVPSNQELLSKQIGATPMFTGMCSGITVYFLLVRESTKSGGVSRVKLDRRGRFSHLFWMTAGQVGQDLCGRDQWCSLGV